MKWMYTYQGEGDLPSGWEKTHEEYKKPIKDGLGYYIYTYESEHFLISQDNLTLMHKELKAIYD